MTKKILIGLVAAAAMVGCVKRTEVTPAAGSLGSATVSGNVYITTDYRNDTNNSGGSTPWYYMYTWENSGANGVEGLQVWFEIDTDELDPNYSAGNTKETVIASVGSDGSYSATLETPSGGDITYNVEMDCLIYRDITDSIWGGSSNVLASYRAEYVPDWCSTSITINDGESYTMDDNYYWEN